MPRSFYDSNGDLHGDLNGFVEKLDYLEELGVTTILFTPLYESDFYHNYFPTDYEAIDPEFGSMDEYIRFVEAVHAKGMKFLMDMETQYVQSGHPWFDDSYNNPASPYSDFIYYSDSLNLFPAQIFYPLNAPLAEFKGWPGDTHNIVNLDMNHPTVKDWMRDFYLYWVDPNGDGNFDDGVDGFRIDHIMDDLDYKGIFTNMYADFWKPIFEACKEVNPNVFIVGEQSNWEDYGDEMMTASGADAAFNFQLRFALTGEEGIHDMYSDTSAAGIDIDPARVHQIVQEATNRFEGKGYAVTFVENHDTYRWTSMVNNNQALIEVGAALTMLMPGIPSIFYGQELGLPGEILQHIKFDANYLQIRDAFPWTTDVNTPGTAVFHKDTGEWWDVSLHNSDLLQELALSVQKEDQESTWHLYKSLIALRKNEPAFRQGSYEPALSDHPEILGFKRTYGDDEFIVIINISNSIQQLDVPDLMNWTQEAGQIDLTNASIGPYGFAVLSK